MPSFIRKQKNASGSVVVQVIHKRGRAVVGLDHIGSARNEAELETLLVLAEEARHAGQLRMELFQDGGPDLVLERSFSGLLWECLEGVYRELGFDALQDETFKQLALARVIEPASKLDTIRVLSELGLDAPSNSAIHRALSRVIREDYRGALSALCFAKSAPASLTLLLYDVTTLYFEIQKEDGYRKPGLSKERRLEPQITVGLLVDASGFPLEVASFEGNKAETRTIVPVLEGFAARHGLERVTVTADAAMLSGGNLTALEDLGYHYIVGSRLSKTPYAIAEHLKEPGARLQDGQIFDTAVTVTIAGRRQPRRVVYQYRQKRAELDLRNIETALGKAQKMVDGASEFKRNRFLTVRGAERSINYALAEEARRKAGIKGYVTSLDDPAPVIIDAYHQLFEVERSFRMSKSDLKARPVFHHKRESIEAHLTIVFAALAISRVIQRRTGLSIKRFIQKLAPVRTGVVSLHGTEHTVRPRVPEDVKAVIAALR